MNPNPAVSSVQQVRRRQHPGVGDHDQLRPMVAVPERGQHRDQGPGLGLVPLEQMNRQREPAGVGQ